jgi:hypothetical protein
MRKFLINALRDNGPAGESRHHLTIINATTAAAAIAAAGALYPGTPAGGLEAIDGGEISAEPGQLTSTNALDETGFNAIGGARDMLEDVAGMPNSPPVLAGRCYRAASDLTRLFGLPPGPASARAAERISELQRLDTARTAPAPAPAVVAAAAAAVEQLGAGAGITSDEGPAATSAGVAPATSAGGLPVITRHAPTLLPADVEPGPTIAIGAPVELRQVSGDGSTNVQAGGSIDVAA